MMSEQPTIEVDLILAAIVNDNNGYVEISAKSLESDYSYNVLDLGYDPDKDVLTIRLLDKDEVEYDTKDE
jgi:hypothetical protein